MPLLPMYRVKPESNGARNAQIKRVMNATVRIWQFQGIAAKSLQETVGEYESTWCG